MNKSSVIFLVAATLVVFGTIFLVEKKTSNKGSAEKKNSKQSLRQENAIYYWRTTFKLDDYEKEFLKKNDIRKMYVRFFDVDVNPDTLSDDRCVPVATISFNDSMPDGVEIVPTVFITPEAIKEWPSFSNFLARRIYAMCEYNGISPNEVQFDCDWTTSTNSAFFEFLKNIRLQLKRYYPNIKTSSTIRLHQLSQTPPDVDYGVLMCYNTGNFKDFDIKNSILDIEDMKPYLKYIKNYTLPLCLALPAYEWNVVFERNHEFKYLDNNNLDVSDTSYFESLGDNLYASKGGALNYYPYVRHESVSAQKLFSVKKMMFEKNGAEMPIVLYHLDSKQLTKYSDNKINEIYR